MTLELCIICNRKDRLMKGNIHYNWCWWCIKNKMEGRRYNGSGQPWQA